MKLPNGEKVNLIIKKKKVNLFEILELWRFFLTSLIIAVGFGGCKRSQIGSTHVEERMIALVSSHVDAREVKLILLDKEFTHFCLYSLLSCTKFLIHKSQVCVGNGFHRPILIVRF